MFDSRIIALGVISFVMLWFAAMTYQRDRKNLAFAFLLSSIGLWALVIGGLFLSSEGYSSDFLGRLSYVFGSSIAVLFCLFALRHTGKKLDVAGYFILFFPLALIILLDLFTNFFIRDVFVVGEARGFLYGDLRFFLDAHFVLYFGAGFFFFTRYIQKETEPAKKQQYLFITAGTIVGVALSAATNIILPLYGRFDLLWAGPVGAGVWASILAYSVLRDDLVNIRVITTQMFVSVFLLIYFIHIFEFHTSEQLALNLFIFGITAALGFFLMQSVIHEVRQREDLLALSAKLQHANDDLKKLDESKSEFITIASHQMRTPLSTSKGYISILMEGTFGKLSAGQIEALHKIYVTNERLIKLIDDLLSLSRIEAGKILYDFKRTDLVQAVKEVVEESAPITEKKHLRIIVTMPSFPAPYVLADVDKIHQVILNLLDNALRYTDRGGAEIRFYQTNIDEKPYLGMIVEDSGRGIDPEDLAHLFTKFTRSERTRKLYTEGSGLGLYVAKKVIEDHNGRIYATSGGVGKGSSFFVELPIVE
ncbi:MAG: PAS/PAC sensor signal transduction histidine kinase [Parcubacteria group bacterium GW2011_GWA2_47_10]|nr:MAG: PAS/PAC sensor signal transduction histidine kinase [Parcubacteria group bacterium GW2011_GWA2_47_10]